MRKRRVVYFNIVIGSLLVALAYYFLFLPQNIVIGGVTGISVILSGIFGEEFSSSIFIFLLNMIFLLVGLLFFGKEFFFNTLLGSIILPLFIFILELLNVPPDILFKLDELLFKVSSEAMNPISQVILTVLLGSILTGIGLGLCFRVNATTGGMDILQKIVAKVFHFPYSKTVYVTDGIVVLISVFVFGIEKTMYSLISIYLIGIIIDLVHMGGSSRRTAFILSKKNEEIKQVIIDKLGRGVTVVDAFGGYSGYKYDMLITTLNKNESYLMRDLILEIDPLAFTFYVSAKEVYGDGFEKQ